MLVTLNWLKQYVDIEESADEIAEMLTYQGLEISQCSAVRPSLEKVITGRILSVNPHPNGDKLLVCRVNTGADEATIVCGAPNVQPDDNVPVALPGAVLPDGAGPGGPARWGRKTSA